MALRHGFVLGALGVAVFCASSADARPHSSAPSSGAQSGNAPPGTSPPPITESRPGGEASAYAEERMHAGDCAAALDAFDQALRHGDLLPELVRDRGICHEKLGHPYPAIDDYRVYLGARPDAPDADQIRVRLEALEAQNPSAKPIDHSKDPTSASVSGSAASAEKGGSLEAIERSEELDTQADGSSLRRGTGFALAIHFDAAHYGSSGFGWAEGAGLDLRYALTRISSILVGGQFMDVNSGGTAESLSGPGVILGYEARLALNPRVNDAILLGATFGYESLKQTATGATFGVIEPKLRVGYRHVFGPTFGLEGSFDGGPAWVHLSDAPAGVSATQSSSVIGGHVGIVLGF